MLPTADEITRIRKEVSAGRCASPDVTVLSAHELKRIKHESAVFSKEQLLAQKKRLEIVARHGPRPQATRPTPGRTAECCCGSGG